MRILQAVFVSLLVFVATGCGKGTSTVFLTIDASGTVRGVDRFRIVVTQGSQTSLPTEVPLANRPADIPPQRTLPLVFDREREGEATIRVEALDAEGRTLAFGAGMVSLMPSAKVDARILLQPAVALPAPTVTGVMPPKGSTAGGIALVVTGANFQRGAILTIDGVSTTEVVWISDSQLTAKLPPRPGAAGKVSVTVKNPDGQSATKGDGFVYYLVDIRFLPEKTYATTGSRPNLVEVADFNGDMKPDLVVAGSGDGSQGSAGISVLIGNGDGTFERAVPYPLGMSSGGWVAIEDLNGDSRDDLITSADGNLIVLLGAGDGSFGPARSFAGSLESRPAIGDFNGDGTTDIVGGAPGEVPGSVYHWGNGDGTFQPAISMGNPSFARVLAADLNADRKLDLVGIGMIGAKGGDVFLGKGDGAFEAPKPFMVNVYIQGMTTGLFDDGATLDLVGVGPTDAPGSGGASLLRGSGDGAFSAGNYYTTSSLPFFPAAADMDLDGSVDLVLANVTLLPSSTLTFLRNRGDGTFERPVYWSVVQKGAGALAVADLNGDRKPDIITTLGGFGVSFGVDEISVLINDGK